MCGRLWGDGGVVSFPGGVADGELDDPGRGSRGAGRQSGHRRPRRQRAGGRGRRPGQMLALGDNIIVKLGIEPAQLGQFDQRVHRPGGLPVDQGNGHAVPGDDVPRGHVAVADHLVRAAQVPAVPGNHTASAGGRNARVAWCRSRSRTPSAAAPSRLQGRGWVNEAQPPSKTGQRRTTRGMLPGPTCASCADSTYHRADGTHDAGIIRWPGPRTGPRPRPMRSVLRLLTTDVETLIRAGTFSASRRSTQASLGISWRVVTTFSTTFKGAPSTRHVRRPGAAP
jgi:hypothetical protein